MRERLLEPGLEELLVEVRRRLRRRPRARSSLSLCIMAARPSTWRCKRVNLSSSGAGGGGGGGGGACSGSGGACRGNVCDTTGVWYIDLGT